MSKPFKSRLQKQVGDVLRETFPKYEILEDYRPDWLKSKLGNNMELDFYIPDLKLAVEVQGIQHYKFTPEFHRSMKDFEDQLDRDRLKNKILTERGIGVQYIRKFENIANLILNAGGRIKKTPEEKARDKKLRLAKKKAEIARRWTR